MGNLIEYVENNMNTMARQPFNIVDSLVLSQLSYLRFERIVPMLPNRSSSVRIADLLKAEMFGSMLQNLLDPESNKRFLFVLAASPRFRNIGLNHYVNLFDPVLEKQFAAVTCFLEDETAYVAYRGTDSTFVGWKEDFNMAYISPVPSQESGTKYLDEVARRTHKLKLRVGGHSKGGNLAVYAAIKCDPRVQKRIIAVFNHDGPGFKDSLFECTEYSRIKDRIHTTLPEESLVGMLLQHHSDYSVVKSSRRGVMQHDPFSWIVENDDFSYAEHIDKGAMHRNKALNEWLSGLSDEKRKQFVDVLFHIIEKTNADTIVELSDDWRRSVGAILSAIKGIDPESRKFVLQAINDFARLSIRNLFGPKSLSSNEPG